MRQILRQGLARNGIVVLTCLVLGAGLFGLGYWQGERAARQQMKAIAAHSPYPSGNRWPGAEGANPNAPRFMQPPGANLPANATPEMKEFMENRTTLMEKMAELRQQNPSANGAPDPKILAQFREQNKALFDRQQQLAQVIGRQQAKNPLPEPPPLQIPPDATPEMKTYLTARDQLMRDQVAFMNQHRTDEPPARQAAMQQWRQQNAARFQQLQQEAQAMAQNNTSPTQPTSNTPATGTTSTTTK